MPARPIHARHRAAAPAQRRLRLAGVVALTVLTAALTTVWTQTIALAAPTAPPGAVGHDVSTPQCGRTLPTSGAFAIVGVTGGRAFSANPCFADEYRWASARPAAAAVYINTGNPAPTSNYASRARPPRSSSSRTAAAWTRTWSADARERRPTRRAARSPATPRRSCWP